MALMPQLVRKRSASATGVAVGARSELRTPRRWRRISAGASPANVASG